MSFEVRANQDKGIFNLCNDLDVENIIWRPLRRKATLEHNWPLLNKLADKYHKTESQIILNWITHLGYRPMVFSTNPQHINENDDSLNFDMDIEEYTRLTDFRPRVTSLPHIDWNGARLDDDIVGLVKNVDKLIIE